MTAPTVVEGIRGRMKGAKPILPGAVADADAGKPRGRHPYERKAPAELDERDARRRDRRREGVTAAKAKHDAADEKGAKRLEARRARIGEARARHAAADEKGAKRLEARRARIGEARARHAAADEKGAKRLEARRARVTEKRAGAGGKVAKLRASIRAAATPRAATSSSSEPSSGDTGEG
jgi:hypothetical protein